MEMGVYVLRCRMWEVMERLRVCVFAKKEMDNALESDIALY